MLNHCGAYPPIFQGRLNVEFHFSLHIGYNEWKAKGHIIGHNSCLEISICSVMAVWLAPPTHFRQAIS